MSIYHILQKSMNDEALTAEEALEILNFPDNRLDELFDAVYEVRLKYNGNKVSVQILSNAKSGNCSQDCHYCAQSCKSTADIAKFKLIEYDRLLSNAAFGKDNKVSIHCIGLSGIRFCDEEIDRFCDYIRKLKSEVSTKICCSIGFLTLEQAKKLKEAGISRINHNLNTGRNFYKNICTTHLYDERINNIKMLRSIGFEICSGGIIGLGESERDIIDMLLDLREIYPEAVPINFFVPIKGAVFGDKKFKLSEEYCLKVLALAKFMLPRSSIRCAAGRELYIKKRPDLLFKAVNSIFASGYLTTGGESLNEAIKLIESNGFVYDKHQ